MKLMVFYVVVVASLMLRHGRALTREEDLELERQLNLLNKPAVKTFQYENGDIFDCVDIYKQPAFDHPFLQGHQIQMEPTSYPIMMTNESSTKDTNLLVELPRIPCPDLTIPIRRIKKDDLIRTNGSRDVKDSGGERYWAILKTNEGRYFGSQANLNVYGIPEVVVGQISSSEIFVTNRFSGPEDHMNTVQAGWTVHPRIYGDTRTRFFIYWTADGYKNTGCYDLQCPAFIKTSKEVGLGSEVKPLSTYGGPQKMIQITIFKDPNTKEWWLMFGDKPLGYWPTSLFNSLVDQASEIYWGGQVFTRSDLRSPPMGSGHFPDEGFGKACHVRDIQLIDNTNKLYRPDKKNQYNFANVPQCYNMGDAYVSDTAGYMFYFGGPAYCH